MFAAAVFAEAAAVSAAEKGHLSGKHELLCLSNYDFNMHVQAVSELFLKYSKY